MLLAFQSMACQSKGADPLKGVKSRDAYSACPWRAYRWKVAKLKAAMGPAAKLRGAFEGALEGATVDAIEAAKLWDALEDAKLWDALEDAIGSSRGSGS